MPAIASDDEFIEKSKTLNPLDVAARKRDQQSCKEPDSDGFIRVMPPRNDRTFQKIRGCFPMLTEEVKMDYYMQAGHDYESFLLMIQKADLHPSATAIARNQLGRLTRTKKPAQEPETTNTSNPKRRGNISFVNFKASRFDIGYETFAVTGEKVFVTRWSCSDDPSIAWDMDRRCIIVTFFGDEDGFPKDRDRSHQMKFFFDHITSAIRFYRGSEPSSTSQSPHAVDGLVIWESRFRAPNIFFASDKHALGLRWKIAMRDFTNGAMSIATTFRIELKDYSGSSFDGIRKSLERRDILVDEIQPLSLACPLFEPEKTDLVEVGGGYFVSRDVADLLSLLHFDVLVQLACLLSTKSIYIEQLTADFLAWAKQQDNAMLVATLERLQHTVNASNVDKNVSIPHFSIDGLKKRMARLELERSKRHEKKWIKLKRKGDAGEAVASDSNDASSTVEDAPTSSAKPDPKKPPPLGDSVHQGSFDEHGGEHMPIIHCRITPTRTIFFGPIKELSNRVLREFRQVSNRFLRVKYTDEDGKKVNSTQFPTILLGRVVDTMERGISIPLMGHLQPAHRFLCYSASQLREHSTWFFAPDPSRGFTETSILNFLGNFSQIHPAAKCAARMGQALGGTYDVMELQPDQVVLLPDILTEDGQYNFTDGCGRMSRSLGRDLAQILRLDFQPSVFQIRLGGYKGVFTVDKSDEAVKHTKHWVITRKSMLKFPSTHLRLEILEWSKNAPEAHLNQQLAILLSDLGVNDELLEIQCFKSLQRLGRLTQGDAGLALSSLRPGDGTAVGVEGLVRSALLAGIPTTEYFLGMVLQELQEKSLRSFESMQHRIRIPESRFFIGVPDAEARVLGEGEVFLRPSTLRRGVWEAGKPVVGTVAVTRFPCHHPGDIRLLQAVDRNELHHMHDCLLFPTVGDRDHPSEMSGGDVDGDHYLVIWNPELIPPFCHSPNAGTDELGPEEMANYGNVIGADLTKPVTMKEIKDFFVQYIEHDQLGPISTAFVSHWDIEAQRGGSLNEKCLRLAELSSYAVDAAKTGKIPCLPPDLALQHQRGQYKNHSHVLSRLLFLAQKEVANIRSKRVRLPEAVAPLDMLIAPDGAPHLADALQQCEKFVEELMMLLSQYASQESTLDFRDFIDTGKSRKKSGYRLFRTRKSECARLISQFISEFEAPFAEKYGKDTFHDHPIAQAEMSIKASAWYEAGYMLAAKLQKEGRKGWLNALYFGWIMHEHIERLSASRPVDTVDGYTAEDLFFDDADDGQGNNSDVELARAMDADERPRKTALHIHPQFLRRIHLS
eukprot:c25905_g1_i1.p1 GENE.c25905_g1_i1~~c25905_g1_i1.p1  ORF type:complete len:1442 (+),score=298.08 c25905_g1_i1:448-4326(+)